MPSVEEQIFPLPKTALHVIAVNPADAETAAAPPATPSCSCCPADGDSIASTDGDSIVSAVQFCGSCAPTDSDCQCSGCSQACLDCTDPAPCTQAGSIAQVLARDDELADQFLHYLRTGMQQDVVLHTLSEHADGVPFAPVVHGPWSGGGC